MSNTVQNVKQKINAETLYHLNFVGDPQLSPDGRHVVYVQTTINDQKEYESHLYMYDKATGQSTQWTHGESRNQSPRWSADGKQIAFQSNRSGKNQIWILPVTGGEAYPLTDIPNGASNPVWHPSEQKLLFQTTLEENEDLHSKEEETDDELKPYIVEHLHYKADGKGFLDGKRSHIVLYDLEADRMEQLTFGPHNHGDPSWSPDGSSIAYVRSQDDQPGSYMKSDLFVKPLDQEAYALNQTSGSFSKPNWSPDGKSISYLGHNQEYDSATLTKVWVHHLDSNEATCLTEKADLECSDVNISDLHWANPSPGAVWTKDGTGLYFQGTKSGNTNIYSVDLNGDVSKVISGDRHLYAFSYDPQTDEAVIGSSDPTHIGDLFSVSLYTKKEEQLTQSNQSFEQDFSISAPERLTYQSHDGLEVEGGLLKPADFDETKKYPFILQIHGGPHMMYGNSFMHEFQLLASKGYVVLYTNPRGSQGYGQSFVDACRSDYGGGDYEDVMAGVDAALDRYSFIDEDNLFVTGGSYGGFMTNWIVSHTNRFKAAVTQRSISNWHSFYGVSDIGHFFTKWEIGNHFTENPEKLWDHSPIKYVNQIETPLLIIHSEKDYRCPIEQAEQLFVALKNENKTTRFVRFPESDHNLSRTGKPHLRVARLNEIAGWFDQYL